MSSTRIADHHPSRTLVAGSWIAIFVPLFSLGLMTAVLFAIAAAAARSRTLALSAAGYAVVTAIVFAAIDRSDLIFAIALVILMFGAAGHATWVRHRVVWAITRIAESHPQHRSALAPAPPETAIAADPAVQAAMQRRTRRQQARRLLSTDPNMATELAIGRPDLPRDFDDGGLVDANNVPEAVLARLPGVTTEMATQIAAASRGHTLTSVEDLVVFADIPFGLAESLREYLIYRERC
ncbi:hypothetical protein [Nocardia wallacei]|uniref:hypothetical protein n=1 Tax=Nocardia wallacei TaxID=480035 RepID=UPI0024570D81|nr:hypothetical protein [Nocardia wallacei]